MMNHDIFEEKRATASAIIDAAETFPFLNDKRLITIKNSGLFQKGGLKDDIEKLKAYMADLPETSCLLFMEDKVEKTSALYKAVGKYGQAVEFKKLSERELAAWIKKICKDNGMEMDAEVSGLFLQTVGSDMENIEGELMKLIAYKGEEKMISAEDIREVCTVSLEAIVFDLVKAVAEKRPAKAVQIYRQLLFQKESPYMILSLITRQFRFILESKLLSESGMTNDAIAAKLEIRDFAVKEYLRQSARFSASVWKESMRDCLETDLNIKSGKAAEETAVELLIIKYATM
jgi:DNA polymerase-3 subunit delta